MNRLFDCLMQAHLAAGRAIYTLLREQDAKNGVASFLEKRAARYPARVSSDMLVFYPRWKEPAWE